MTDNDVEYLKNQLFVARNEINKLRQQVKSLQHVQRKDIEDIQKILKDFRCGSCQLNNLSNQNLSISSSDISKDNNLITFKPIGVIRTAFPEKRAVPRQSSVAGKLKGIIDLIPDVFTNPEHSLQGLKEFSHLWIIYHFHRNNSHSKAKVAPPRLGGEKVGVFSTKSPHRPCPIGLSLVEINKIEGSIIHFSGTDMVDETPVLDIKPYIPFYDAPFCSNDSGRSSVGPDIVDFYNSRQEPDGEESDTDINGAVGNSLTPSINNYNNSTNNHQITTSISPMNPEGVKIPNWIVSGQTLSVIFNDRAESQMRDLKVERKSIINVLETDPRSVYLRTKYGSQIFTFQLSEVTVTCKFDDKNSTVTVVQVRRTENVQDENY